jgi:DNA-binding NarL/FixJ family response regulator
VISVLLVAAEFETRRRLWTQLWLEADICLAVEANNGARAIELAHALRPTVAVIDFALAGMDGITTAAMLRPLAYGTQIILLSHGDNAELRDRAYAVGVFRILDIETNSTALLATIRHAAAYQER